jgi:hypothetical protein
MSDMRADEQALSSALRRSDADLATASGNGEPSAFGELVLRHQDRAYNLAFRLTGSPEDAADAVVPATVVVLHLAVPDRGERGAQPAEEKPRAARGFQPRFVERPRSCDRPGGGESSGAGPV